MNELEQYSKELGIHGVITLDELINSHRELRALNTKNHDEFMTERKDAIDRAVKQCIENNWFSRYQLRSMSVVEIMELLR